MRNPKFNVGDVLVRSAHKNDSCAFLRDEITIEEIVSDGRPFCPQLWYICKDYKGKIVSGLVGVVDSAFCKK